MNSFNLAHYLSQSASGVGLLGAVVGGSAAAAKNYKSLREGSISYNDALYDTGKEGLGAGVATAISAVAAGAVGGGFAVSLGTAFLAAFGAKYAWDQAVVKVEALTKDEAEKNSDLAVQKS